MQMMFIDLINRMSVRAFLTVCATLSMSCTVDKPAFDELAMTRPGISQDELDEYASDRTKYILPFIKNVFAPEEVIAYEAAAAKLNDLRSSQLARGQHGLGRATDYLIGIGDLDDVFVIAFIPRYRENTKEEIAEAQRMGDTHWTAYYNTGNWAPIIFLVSKADLSIACHSELFSECIPEK